MNKTTLEKFTIKRSASVKEALKQLDLTAEKTLLIVEGEQLLGAITDGDIRRHLIQGGGLNETIESVYNRKPAFIKKANLDINLAKEILLTKKIQLIPVVDDENNVVDALTVNDVFSGEPLRIARKKIDLPVIIMAGGKGTRLEPFTTVLPKPLIPIGEKTILELIIDEFREFDIRDFILTLNYKGAMIEAYLNSITKEYKTRYLYEKEFLGTASSLNLADKFVKTDFIVSNCDVIVKADFAEVYNFHKNNNAALTVLTSVQHITIPYGVINSKSGGVVTEIIEKPEHSYAVNTGVYMISKKCLKFIPKDKHFDMTDLIDILMKNNEKVLAYPVNQNDYIDFGQWSEYKKALEKLTI